jgi:hypothetical protein
VKNLCQWTREKSYFLIAYMQRLGTDIKVKK